MFITKFLHIHNQAKIYHWQTKSYAEHQAMGGFYDKFGEQIDEFVEAYFGRNGVRRATKTFDLELKNYEGKASTELMNDGIQFVTTELESVIEGDTDLQNIRDEMLALMNHTKYLLTLS